jgi:hypothetical protein
MRPLLWHLAILALLAVPGILACLHAQVRRGAGGLFSAVTLLGVYWLCFGLYAAVSTGAVLLTDRVFKLRNVSFGGWGVLVGHAIPVGIVWAGIWLGLHDFLGDLLKSRVHGQMQTSHAVDGHTPKRPALVSPPRKTAGPYRAPRKAYDPAIQAVDPATDKSNPPTADRQ